MKMYEPLDFKFPKKKSSRRTSIMVPILLFFNGLIFLGILCLLGWYLNFLKNWIHSHDNDLYRFFNQSNILLPSLTQCIDQFCMHSN